ncbi:MAG: hypothetical protein KJ645_10705, partial [Planctomycetes bacterium]|nr:hypothetical protein [Planctomycetota bacterium]
GVRGLLGPLLDHKPAYLDWVTHDKGMLAIAEPFIDDRIRNHWRSPELTFYETDGRYFVKDTDPETYDLILVDVPDPANANLNRYYTKEFFQECRRILKSHGVIVLGMSSQPNYMGEAMQRRNGSVYIALCESFPQVLVTPGSFGFFAAGKTGAMLCADPAQLIQRYETRGVPGDRFSPQFFYTLFEEGGLEWINALLQKVRIEATLPPNQDDLPVAYFADFEIETAITSTPGEEGGTVFVEKMLFGSGKFMGLGKGEFVFLLLSVPGLIFFFQSRRRSRRLTTLATSVRLLVGLTAFVSGFSGIVLETDLLFLFQNVSGHLYSLMGLIIALYMAGLSAGSLIFSKQLTRPAHSFLAALLALGIGIAGVLILLPFMGRWFPGHLIILVLCGGAALCMGAAGGFGFRGVVQAFTSWGTVGGGLLYGLDILGTSLGGLLVGTFMLPVWGVRVTLGMAALLMALFCCLSLLALRGSVQSRS